MFKIFLYVLLGLIVAAVAGAFFLPSSYTVERSIVIAAEPAQVYPAVSDLRTWKEWTAWTQERDPDCKWTYEGEEGTGSKMVWEGDELGQGELTISSADPANGIEFDLAFDEGAYLSKGSVRLEKTADGTKVIWINGGELGNNPINRWFGLAMDSMMGGEFETCLEGLKKRVETPK